MEYLQDPDRDTGAFLLTGPLLSRSELTSCSHTESQKRLWSPCIASCNDVFKRIFILLEDKDLLGCLKHTISYVFLLFKLRKEHLMSKAHEKIVRI